MFCILRVHSAYSVPARGPGLGNTGPPTALREPAARSCILGHSLSKLTWEI